MKGYIPIEIPTKLYIKGFILAELGEKPVMDRDNLIGCKMCDLLNYRTNEFGSKKSSRYNTTIKLYIRYYIFKHRGHHLNFTNLKNFNQFIEKYIKDRFYFLMDFYIDVFPSFEANLPTVRKHLKISEEYWDTDSMRKDYYRYRLEIGKPLFYNKSLRQMSHYKKLEINKDIFTK